MVNQSKFGIPEFVSHKGNAERRAVLENNKRLRNRIEPLGHQDFGSVVLSIPELDFMVICRRYPELLSPDAEISTRAFDKFLSSSESIPYRVRATDGKRGGRLAK